MTTNLVAHQPAPSAYSEERAALLELGAPSGSSRIGRCRACDRVYVWDSRVLGSLRGKILPLDGGRRTAGGDGVACPVHGTQLSQTTYLALASRGRGGSATLWILEPSTLPPVAALSPTEIADEELSQSELRERGLKRCPRCGDVKDRAGDFTHRADGSVFSWCRDCNRAYRAERRDRARGES